MGEWIKARGLRVRGEIAQAWTGVVKRIKTRSLKQILMVVVALSLWMGTGNMRSSEALGKEIQPTGEAFGEVHWYQP